MTNKQKGENTYREIFCQPLSFEAVNRAMAGSRSVLDAVFSEKTVYDNIIFTGCGTSYYLAQSAAHIFSEQTGRKAAAVPCSELYFFPEVYLSGTKALVIPITRKSTTTEVRMAIDRARGFPSVTTMAVTCDPGSSEYNDYMLLSPEAGEESVVMTRSFTSMLYLITLMALYVGGKEDLLSRACARIAAFAEECLPRMEAFAKQIVDEHAGLGLYVTLGQGDFYGVACESMNKMKEMGLVCSEAYHSMEYRHGPMSIADGNTLVLTLAHSASLEYDAALLTQMKGFGAVTAVVGDDVSSFNADYSLSLGLGLGDAVLAPVIGIVGQMLGYYIAQSKGLDADFPRNLSQVIVL